MSNLLEKIKLGLKETGNWFAFKDIKEHKHAAEKKWHDKNPENEEEIIQRDIDVSEYRRRIVTRAGVILYSLATVGCAIKKIEDYPLLTVIAGYSLLADLLYRREDIN